MTERSRGAAVAGAHRIIRTLADGEGPFPGELVTRGPGLAVRVDAERLRGWAGWGFAGAEHVAAPLDLAVRGDGQDALLPWCVRTVRAHLSRAADAGGIAQGEAVTLAVSLLRGVLEAAAGPDAPEPPCGVWWLTDEARPVFAIDAAGGSGDGSAPGEAGAQLLQELEAGIEDRALRRLLARLAEALHDVRRLAAEASRWEGELLEVAAPRPLRIDVEEVAGARAATPLGRAASARAEERPLRRRDLRVVAGERDPGRPVREASVWGRVLPALRGLLRTGARDAGRFRGGRAGRPSGRRRWAGPGIVAASAAAVIAVAGALWPSGTGSAGASDRPAAVASTSAPTSTPAPASADPSPSPSRPGADAGAVEGATATPRPPAEPGASSQTDPRAAAEELIAAARRCETEPVPACSEVWDGGAPRAVSLRATDGAPVLIEDYGDVAAIRDGDGGGAQMIVIIRRDAEWRIRDVYDIADPPSEGAVAPGS